MTEVDELLIRLCAGCIADFNGGFPDFDVEKLKTLWTGEGHCLRCNAILNPESVPEYWRSFCFYKGQIAKVDELIAETRKQIVKDPECFSLGILERSWLQHRDDLLKEREKMQAEWKKLPLGAGAV